MNADELFSAVTVIFFLNLIGEHHNSCIQCFFFICMYVFLSNIRDLPIAQVGNFFVSFNATCQTDVLFVYFCII